VVKVSWKQARAFCQWLTQATGLNVTLPTETQWEWACRAGSAHRFWYGSSDVDFAVYENLADAQMQTRGQYQGKRWQWRPALGHQDDGYRVSAPVGSFRPNPWGLYDMHGNVAEWTLSAYQSTDPVAVKRVIRGGAWSDRPKWAGAGIRWGYYEHQKVYNVGFRVVVKDERTTRIALGQALR
jgi:formylglycine-generating enzyme required for sulfatase activity